MAAADAGDKPTRLSVKGLVQKHFGGEADGPFSTHREAM